MTLDGSTKQESVPFSQVGRVVGDALMSLSPPGSNARCFGANVPYWLGERLPRLSSWGEFLRALGIGGAVTAIAVALPSCTPNAPAERRSVPADHAEPTVAFAMQQQDPDEIEAKNPSFIVGKAKATNVKSLFDRLVNAESTDSYPPLLLIGDFGEFNGKVDLDGVFKASSFGNEKLYEIPIKSTYVASVTSSDPAKCEAMVDEAYQAFTKPGQEPLGSEHCSEKGCFNFDNETYAALKAVCKSSTVKLPEGFTLRSIPRADVITSEINVEGISRYPDKAVGKEVSLDLNSGWVVVVTLGSCYTSRSNIGYSPCDPKDPAKIPDFKPWLGLMRVTTDSSGGVTAEQGPFFIFRIGE